MTENIVTKQCSHCKQILPILSFGKNKSTKTGYQLFCKSCQYACNIKYLASEKGKSTREKYKKTESYKISEKNGAHKYYIKNIESRKIYSRKYNSSPQGRLSAMISTQNQRAKNPEKRKAQTAIANAIQRGRIRKAATYHCRYCWKPAQQYHHHLGYAPEHWLDVQPICIQCHVGIHHI